MIQSIRWVGLCLVCAVLVGCVNLKPKKIEMNTYSLGDVNAATAVEVNGPTVFVARPHLPAYIDGKRLQYRSANGEVKQLSRARWAEPLEEGIARCLAEYLIDSGMDGVTGFYPWPKRAKDGSELRVHFYKLGAQGDGTIRMAAAWDLRKDSQVIKSGTFESKPIQWEAGSADSLVTAINEALKQLATEIVREI